jgi:ribosomal protein L17
MNKCQSLLLRPNVAALLNNEETKTNVQKAKEMQNSLSSFANKESIQKFLAAEREIQLKMNAIIQNDI